MVVNTLGLSMFGLGILAGMSSGWRGRDAAVLTRVVGLDAIATDPQQLAHSETPTRVKAGPPLPHCSYRTREA